MQPVVSTPFGTARGIERGAVCLFKGIRYAMADRFQPPTLIDSWPNELDASTYGAQCHQSGGVMERALGASSLPMSEDCLFLNVWTPACDDGARPVLVWIHGGAYTTGSGAMPWYDGTALAERGDVVVVTINYRLGALGFAGRDNLGLRDQVCALQWVNRAIRSFGGDPENVTIFGESAGGSALLALMATPSAEGLFHRAYAMSPSITQLRSGERADEALQQFLDAAGAATLDDLRDAPVARIIAAQLELLRDARAGFTGFSPCHDGDLVPRPIVEAACASPVPLVLGTNRDEMLLYSAFNPALADVSDDALNTLFARRFGEGAGTALQHYRDARPGASNLVLAAALQTDETFRSPARQLAERRSAAGLPTWMYWFTWASPAFDGRLGSCHALDIPFAFHTLGRNGVDLFTGDGPDRQAVADAYSGAVLHTARHGAPAWSPYDEAGRATYRFDVEHHEMHDPEPAIRALWSA